MADTMKRIALWALGQMLPREEVFDHHIRNMARGVTYLVCGGMIIASVFLALVAAMYFALVAQGLSIALSATITGIVALLGAAVCFLLADKSLSRAAKLTDELTVKPPKLPTLEASVDLQQGAVALASAFIDGLTGRPDTPYQRRKHEALLARLEELEAELEAELAAQETAEEFEEELEEELLGNEKDIIHFRARTPRRKRKDY